ncbi:histidine kinase [Undibacterium cyanobacteriorum]|uniref:Histidine kinase n=1 Tax=Undibacterium cyanobacteriorum TaxID=3073561 RepID=A0ABY9RJ26_9BURK|nr:histidine kinase [Undibacterium sp. 20NA77.5]WMW80679.1 histidine kinase [Undibacterium sp. 20NA77.5]
MDTGKPNQVLPRLLSLIETSKRLWWQFFDWLAVVSWSYLVFVSFICLIIAGILGLGSIVPLLVFSSFLIKSLAGGKRKAEIAADAASVRANMEALERRVLEAEMASLQAQIEPHFLFNTLALIGQLIETEPEQASIVHGHLIKYLRAALPQIREKGNSKLGQQIELCRAYLNIMQARMQERLSFSIDCPKELQHYAFPPMMIQTLVENAIKHGLEPKTEGGHIHIGAHLGESEIVVDVNDNGLGFDLQANEGIGLSNIRERLKVLYGFRAALSIEVPETGGAHLSLHIPV